MIINDWTIRLEKTTPQQICAFVLVNGKNLISVSLELPEDTGHLQNETFYKNVPNRYSVDFVSK